MDQATFCCGMREIGEMQIISQKDEDSDDLWMYQSCSEPLDKALDVILKDAGGRPVMFNFVCHRNFTGKFDRLYQASQFRSIVKKFKGVKYMGTWVNPGTLNKIDCYIIPAQKEKV